MISYYDRPELSNSGLTDFKRELYGGVEIDPVHAKFGNLIDHMITEQEKVNYFQFTCSGEKMTEDDFHCAEEMKKSFMRDEYCVKILAQSDTQKIMINPDQSFDYDIPFRIASRCKWDLYINPLGWGGDIKSTAATTQKQFEDAIHHFDYDRSRFFYMNIAGADKDIIIGISKVNFKIFKVQIKRGDLIWNSGRDKCMELAYKYYCMFGNLKQTA